MLGILITIFIYNHYHDLHHHHHEQDPYQVHRVLIGYGRLW